MPISSAELFSVLRIAAVDLDRFQFAHLHQREQMIFRLAGGAEDAQAGSIGPRQQVGADGAGGGGAQAGDGDVIRQLARR